MNVTTSKSFRSPAPGDAFGVVWPASPCDLAEPEQGAAALRGLGYQVLMGPAEQGPTPYLAGEDRDRAQSLTRLLENSEIAGVVAARGGYGCLRAAPFLDFQALALAGKPLVGFSDLTVLLSALLREGLCSIHGPTLSSLGRQSESLQNRLAQILAGDWPVTEPLQGRVLLDQGPGQGYLVGGNLTVLAHLVGTPWQPPTQGGIVFLEDVGEKLYRLDRALTHLISAGFFDGCQGVALGGFEGTDYQTALEMATERLQGLGITVLAGLPFGHGAENAALLVGGPAELDPEAGVLRPLDGNG